MWKFTSDTKILLLLLLLFLRINVSLSDYMSSLLEDFNHEVAYFNKIKQITSKKKDIEKIFSSFLELEKKNCSSIIKVSSEAELVSLLESRVYKLSKQLNVNSIKIKWGTPSNSKSIFSIPLQLELTGRPRTLLEFWCSLSRNLRSLRLDEFSFIFRKNSSLKAEIKSNLRLRLRVFAVRKKFCMEDEVD